MKFWILTLQLRHLLAKYYIDFSLVAAPFSISDEPSKIRDSYPEAAPFLVSDEPVWAYLSMGLHVKISTAANLRRTDLN